MANTSTRVIALIMAAVFLFSSVAVSLGVIVLIRQDNKQKAAETQALVEAQKASKAKQQAIDKTKGGNTLQGTQLSGYTPTTTAAVKVTTEDLKTGDGEEVKDSSEVTAHYTGAVAATGVIFQSSKDSGTPFTTTLDKVIPGWKEGIVGMKVGGTRRIIIPADKAYGANPPQGIPANADLVFDIDLIAVKN